MLIVDMAGVIKAVGAERVRKIRVVHVIGSAELSETAQEVCRQGKAQTITLTIRSKHHVAEKQVIAEIAASLVKEGDHIMLDASSTDLFIAKAIKNIQRLTVVTNSIEIILELSECSNITVICTGGVLKEGYLALLGPEAENSTRSYFVDKAFVSCKALNREHGIMESLQAFSSLKKAILTSAAQSYLVLDNGKFDQTAFTKMVGIEEIDGVITDTRPSDDWLQIFERYGVECMYPPEKRK